MTRQWQQQILTPFVLPARLLAYVRRLEASAGHSHKIWDKSTEKEMDEIRALIYSQLWRSQKGRCAYCGMLKLSERLDREHFLPKRNYLKLMFHPYNIVLACKQCNRDHKKTSTPLSVTTKHGRLAQRHGMALRSFPYKYWHPHFHDPTQYFAYSGMFNAIIKGRNAVAKDTIRLFGWHKTDSVLARVQNQYFLEKLESGEITYKDLGLVGRVLKYKK
jgi:uncharacterized protein (TIGR02646 family)